ncbi:hypothetical protein CONPUDRAFT_80922 [Coniophora puteana RWD-64-598 SS2]|uniref:DUF6533 domain-containing protein n=1 Tax=Coniophora puteana (strain RWD-64-598) TaxID=741705 RepID=A0A5M3MVQ7_CONPW|nr:uncharacterized protein CONPUDRAFT_80922 [Coniophora puteana RWD-64-598 SS2]EIW82671.1 hypothetical protein CONPUDRAFT_80922 [Coniophora puteana RWD-64-598 SS2]
MFLASRTASGEQYLSELQDKRDSLATIYVGFAGFTVLVWDHVITFGDEVEIIWRRPKNLMSILFLLNRYLTPLGFIIFLVAFLDSSWTRKRCEHYIRYQGAMVAIGIQIAGLMMLKRVSALFRAYMWVTYSVALIFVVWVVVTAYLLAHGVAVRHTPVVHSCSMVFDTSSVMASSSAWLPLLYDTVVIGLVIYRTVPYKPTKNPHTIARTLIADNILYYAVIFSVNITLTIMIAVAPAGLKNIGAQVELQLTVAMMSRITLNLPKTHRRLIGIETHSDSHVRPIIFAGSGTPEETLMGYILRMKPIRPLPPCQMVDGLRLHSIEGSESDSHIRTAQRSTDGTGLRCGLSEGSANIGVEGVSIQDSSHSHEPNTVNHCDCKMCARQVGAVCQDESQASSNFTDAP